MVPVPFVVLVPLALLLFVRLTRPLPNRPSTEPPSSRSTTSSLSASRTAVAPPAAGRPPPPSLPQEGGGPRRPGGAPPGRRTDEPDATALLRPRGPEEPRRRRCRPDPRGPLHPYLLDSPIADDLARSSTRHTLTAQSA